MADNRRHSLNLVETIALSRAVALDMGCDYVGSLQFLLASVRQHKNAVAVALRDNAIDLAVLEKLLKRGPAYASAASLPLTVDLENAFKEASLFAERYQSQAIEVEHLVFGIMQKYDFNALLLFHAGFDAFVLEQSMVKHGVVQLPVLFVSKKTRWQKLRHLLKME
jgi:ATP-dependent Clp protease ATP-binding subunit ClpA